MKQKLYIPPKKATAVLLCQIRGKACTVSVATDMQGKPLQLNGKACCVKCYNSKVWGDG